MVIPDGVTKLSNKCFTGCKINSIDFNNVREIGVFAFDSTYGIEELNIPPTIHTIREGAFMGCNTLKNVNIQPGVNKIEDGVFSDCIELVNVIIPGTVETLDNQLFNNCFELKVVSIG